MPQITGTLSINGYSQPGSSPNTNPDLAQGTNAAPKIELDGAGIVEPTTGLLIMNTAPNSVVRGLVIDRFSGSGIIVEPGGSGNRIEGNFIGIEGNDGSGVGIGGLTGGSNTVGGVTPDVRNVISANGGVGVSVGSSGNKVQGNYIGTIGDTTGARGNTLAGVSIGHFGNTVGGTDANSANVIAFNGEDGVRVVNNDSTGNRILSNSIFSNGGLGIDLRPTGSPGGPTPNDTLDPDTGPNNLQNFPDLDSATLSGGQLTVAGNLNTNPSTFVGGKKKKKKPKNVFVPQSFTVQFFSNPSGQDEGKALVGQTTVMTNLFGDAPIDLTFTPSRAISAENG